MLRAGIPFVSGAFLASLILGLLPTLLAAETGGGPAPLSPALERALAQADALSAESRYQEALPFALEALRLGERELGPRHRETATLLDGLAILYFRLGRWAEAEGSLRRAVAIREGVMDEPTPGMDRREEAMHLSETLFMLAVSCLYQNRGEEAERILERVVRTCEEEELGTANELMGDALIFLLGLSVRLDRPKEVVSERWRRLEEFFNYALQEPTARGEEPETPSIDLTDPLALLPRMLEGLVNELLLHPRLRVLGTVVRGLLFEDEGQYAEAEELYREALALAEQGGDPAEIGYALVGLAGLHLELERPEQAEPLLLRALRSLEPSLGEGHPDLAYVLHDLGRASRQLGHFDAAESFYRRALAIREESYGRIHPFYAHTLYTLADMDYALGRTPFISSLGEALQIFNRAVPGTFFQQSDLKSVAREYDRIVRRASLLDPSDRRLLQEAEASFGPLHPEVSARLMQMAGSHIRLGRFPEAEELLLRAAENCRAAQGPDHRDVVSALYNLGRLYLKQDRLSEALEVSGEASAILHQRLRRTGHQRGEEIWNQQVSFRQVFLGHLGALARALEKGDVADRSELLNTAFESSQLALGSRTALAVAQMAARRLDDSGLSRRVREHQDAVRRWSRLDRELLDAMAQMPDERDHELERSLRAEREALELRLDELSAILQHDFVAYAELVFPRPVALAQARALLAPEQALLVYVVDRNVTYLWVIRRQEAELHQIGLGYEALEARVVELRRTLDPWGERGVLPSGDVGRFDLKKAYELYAAILAPAVGSLDGVQHLIVVPDGPLESLPLSVLVTASPGNPDYREAAWLVREFALSALPSVSALGELRSADRTTKTTTFAGFGDPLLEGASGEPRNADSKDLLNRGAVADVEAVRRLPRLPETEQELRGIAQALGAGRRSLFLRERATETRVRRMSRSGELAGYRVVAFATHGLTSGEFEGLVEPALVLTPPAVASEADDGLLTASEITLLELDADWILLSACNTASADGVVGARGLSGLAKAFFYAGARALLVSHWSVDSAATVRLTTEMFRRLAADPTLGRAEALRRSMLKLLGDERNPRYAHPRFWAPFVVVGEAGRRGREGEDAPSYPKSAARRSALPGLDP